MYRYWFESSKLSKALDDLRNNLDVLTKDIGKHQTGEIRLNHYEANLKKAESLVNFFNIIKELDKTLNKE